MIEFRFLPNFEGNENFTNLIPLSFVPRKMYSSDGRLSLQSLSEFESSRSWTTDNGPVSTPPPPRPTEEDTPGSQYMGICLPKKLTMIFPDLPRVPPTHLVDDLEKNSADDPPNQDEESDSECDADTEHCRVCLVCFQGKSGPKEESIDEPEKKLRRYKFPLFLSQSR